MAVVPPAHRMPLAPVPCGFLWLSWAAGKGTDGQIGKEWERHFCSRGTRHPMSSPESAGSLSVAWFFPISLWCRWVAELCEHAGHTDRRGRGTV